ncbi:hypothetical protein HDU67_000705 [Dinochytrium kinnereticum]|nr:hypothetical protein HDU67_000705 [Dinochytrium kinnereticum]
MAVTTNPGQTRTINWKALEKSNGGNNDNQNAEDHTAILMTSDEARPLDKQLVVSMAPNIYDALFSVYVFAIYLSYLRRRRLMRLELLPCLNRSEVPRGSKPPFSRGILRADNSEDEDLDRALALSCQNDDDIDRAINLSRQDLVKEQKRILNAISKKNERFNYLLSITKRSGRPTDDDKIYAGFGREEKKGDDSVFGEQNRIYNSITKKTDRRDYNHHDSEDDNDSRRREKEIAEKTFNELVAARYELPSDGLGKSWDRWLKGPSTFSPKKQTGLSLHSGYIDFPDEVEDDDYLERRRPVSGRMESKGRVERSDSDATKSVGGEKKSKGSGTIRSLLDDIDVWRSEARDDFEERRGSASKPLLDKISFDGPSKREIDPIESGISSPECFINEKPPGIKKKPAHAPQPILIEIGDDDLRTPNASKKPFSKLKAPNTIQEDFVNIRELQEKGNLGRFAGYLRQLEIREGSEGSSGRKKERRSGWGGRKKRFSKKKRTR